jgi:hypothetical protein
MGDSEYNAALSFGNESASGALASSPKSNNLTQQGYIRLPIVC